MMARKTKSARGKVKVSAFDVAEYLTDDATIIAYLNETMRDPDPNVFLLALGDVVRAKGIGAIAKKAGVGRESLYKTLTPGASPRYETIHKLMDAIGIRFNLAA